MAVCVSGFGGRMAKRRRKVKRGTRPARRRAPRASPRTAIESALAGIAHDIRTPLTGILALAELLASSDLGKRERDWANAIKGGAEHLSALTTLIVSFDLLAVAEALDRDNAAVAQEAANFPNFG